MRKGQFVLGYKGIYFIIALFVLTFIFLYLYNAFLDYNVEKTQCTDTVLEEIMIGKFLYGECFTYVDPEVDRALPGTLDMNKFTQETLDTCFSFVEKEIQIEVEGTTIGESIPNPIKVNKTLWIYENNEKRTAIVQFLFKEPAC